MGYSVLLLRFPGQVLPDVAASFAAFIAVSPSYRHDTEEFIDGIALRTTAGEAEEIEIRFHKPFLMDLLGPPESPLAVAVAGRHEVAPAFFDDDTLIDVLSGGDPYGSPRGHFHGPPRYLTPPEVAETSAALQAFDAAAALAERLDVQDRFADDLDMYLRGVEVVRRFYRAAAGEGQAVLMYSG